MYRIWIRYYLNDELVSTSVSAKSYERKANAEKAAQKLYVDRIRESDGTKIHYEWIVAEEDPFSIETRVRKIIEEHDEKLKALENSYRVKFDALYTQNDTIPPEMMLELNEWHRQTATAIREAFVADIMTLSREG